MAARRGKVRHVHVSSDKTRVVLYCSDRISAFDSVLPREIPDKGVILTDMAYRAFEQTRDVCPNWVLSRPSARMTYGIYCEPFKLEVIVRRFLVGGAWRAYERGYRTICGVELPEGLKEGHEFDPPIVTPTTKDEHDENITPDEIVTRGLATSSEWERMDRYARALFSRGTELASNRDLVLVDTKYEFGVDPHGTIRLIDEVHTPDSSRYWYAGHNRRSLSKEFARQWILRDGMEVAKTDAFVNQVRQRYIELYETITGRSIQDVTDRLGDGDDDSAMLMQVLTHGHQGI